MPLQAASKSSSDPFQLSATPSTPTASPFSLKQGRCKRSAGQPHRISEVEIEAGEYRQGEQGETRQRRPGQAGSGDRGGTARRSRRRRQRPGRAPVPRGRRRRRRRAPPISGASGTGSASPERDPPDSRHGQRASPTRASGSAERPSPKRPASSRQASQSRAGSRTIASARRRAGRPSGERRGEAAGDATARRAKRRRSRAGSRSRAPARSARRPRRERRGRWSVYSSSVSSTTAPLTGVTMLSRWASVYRIARSRWSGRGRSRSPALPTNGRYGATMAGRPSPAPRSGSTRQRTPPLRLADQRRRGRGRRRPTAARRGAVSNQGSPRDRESRARPRLVADQPRQVAPALQQLLEPRRSTGRRRPAGARGSRAAPNRRPRRARGRRRARRDCPGRR